jgi:hypothetical protein
MKRKGINYDVGIEFSSDYISRPTFDAQIVHRELEIIGSDLNCNAVRIAGTDIDRLTRAAEDALKQGFEVWLSPHLHDKDEDETLAYTVKCAAAAEGLRQQWPQVVFILGCELTLFMQGILPGDNIFERIGSPAFIENIKTGIPSKRLNTFLTKASEAVRQVFHGDVTYASALLEWVDWRLFDYVCLDHYRAAPGKDSYIAQLKPYLAYNKPVIITEVGCCAYQGAEDEGARGFMIVDPMKLQLRNDGYVRDEGVQARELTDLLTLLDGAGVDSVFVFTFVAPALVHREETLFDLDMASFSVVKSYEDKQGTTYPDMLWEPKEAFKAVADYFAKH